MRLVGPLRTFGSHGKCAEVRTASFRDVLIQPYLSLLDHWRHLPEHHGGPVWPDWRERTFERFNRDGVPSDVEPPYETPGLPVPRMEGTWWWLGANTSDFGHQIADFSTRIAASLLADPEARFVVASRFGADATVSPLVSQILSLYGVEADRVRVVSSAMRVDELRVAEQGEQLWSQPPSSESLFAIRNTLKLPLPECRSDSILYVTRRSFQRQVQSYRYVGGCAADGYIADLVERAGGRVIEPESLALVDQILAYLSHERVVFAEGSAYHALQLLPGASVGTVDVILRRPGGQALIQLLAPRANAFSLINVHEGFVSCDDPESLGSSGPLLSRALSIPSEEKVIDYLASLGGDVVTRFNLPDYRSSVESYVSEYVQACLNQVSDLRARECLASSLETCGLGHLVSWEQSRGQCGQRSVATSELGDGQPLHEKSEPGSSAAERQASGDLMFPWTTRRLNLIQSMRPIASYLEIGLGDGRNFLEISVPQKVGVDPRWSDPSILTADRVFAETSDEFFSEHAPETLDSVDLVYIDGLHTAEQTYRDFASTLDYSHSDTVWLVDDVVPSDYFSSLPDESRALAARAAATSSADQAWHGDVYKMVWLIANFHSYLDFATIIGSGNPQLLVWRGVREWTFTPLSLAEIANLDYSDVLLRSSEFRPCSEEAAMRRMSDALTATTG